MVDNINSSKPLPIAADAAIDWPALHTRFQGRETSIRKLLVTALRTQNETPDKIRHAIHENNLDTLRFISHGLKSVAGFLEAHEVTKLAERIEEDIQKNRPFDVQTGLSLASSMDDLLKTIAAIIN